MNFIGCLLHMRYFVAIKQPQNLCKNKKARTSTTIKTVKFRVVVANLVITVQQGYCCEVQIFAKLLKWPLAEISAIAKFARHEANLHWILYQENV